MIEDLVTRAQAGEGDAWAGIYEHYRLDIFRFMRSRLTVSVEDVEDLTEDVFVKAFANLSKYQYRPGAGFRSWLYTIARNLRADYLRATQKRPVERSLDASPEDGREGYIHEFGRPLATEAPAEDVDARLDVAEALAALPVDQRRVVELRHYQGLSLDETARVVGKSGEAVKKLHVRAMEALREALSVESEP